MRLLEGDAAPRGGSGKRNGLGGRHRAGGSRRNLKSFFAPLYGIKNELYIHVVSQIGNQDICAAFVLAGGSRPSPRIAWMTAMRRKQALQSLGQFLTADLQAECGESRLGAHTGLAPVRTLADAAISQIATIAALQREKLPLDAGAAETACKCISGDGSLVNLLRHQVRSAGSQKKTECFNILRIGISCFSGGSQPQPTIWSGQHISTVIA